MDRYDPYTDKFLRDTQYNILSTNLAEVSTDCISRQAAIDAMDSETVSTNPEHFKSSEKFIEFMDNADISSFGRWQWSNGFNTALTAVGIDLKKLPPAEPQIIRCKDCKNWIPYDWMFSDVRQSRNIDDYPEDEIGCACSDMAMKANDFCSRAERREVTT